MGIDAALALLGLTKATTPQEAKAAYRRRLFEVHPDRHPDDPTATAKTQAANVAYKVVRAFFAQHATNTDKAWAAEPMRTRGADVRVSRSITLREAYTGAVKAWDIKGRRFEVVIEPGHSSQSGAWVFMDDGAPSPDGGDPGDLILKVTVEPDVVFARNGDDLVVHALISTNTATAGGHMVVSTIMGRHFEVMVPAGVLTGDVLRLQGLGMPAHYGGYGAMLVPIKVLTDTDQPSPRRPGGPRYIDCPFSPVRETSAGPAGRVLYKFLDGASMARRKLEARRYQIWWWANYWRTRIPDTTTWSRRALRGLGWVVVWLAINQLMCLWLLPSYALSDVTIHEHAVGIIRVFAAPETVPPMARAVRVLIDYRPSVVLSGLGHSWFNAGPVLGAVASLVAAVMVATLTLAASQMVADLAGMAVAGAAAMATWLVMRR